MMSKDRGLDPSLELVSSPVRLNILVLSLYSLLDVKPQNKLE